MASGFSRALEVEVVLGRHPLADPTATPVTGLAMQEGTGSTGPIVQAMTTARKEKLPPLPLRCLLCSWP